MTSDEAFELYLQANAEEKKAWAAYLKACTATRKASELYDRIVFAKPGTPTHLSMVTDSLKKEKQDAHSKTGS